MKKTIKAYGNSHVINLNVDDMEIYELKEGDIVEVHLLKIKGGENDNRDRRQESNSETIRAAVSLVAEAEA